VIASKWFPNSNYLLVHLKRKEKKKKRKEKKKERKLNIDLAVMTLPSSQDFLSQGFPHNL